MNGGELSSEELHTAVLRLETMSIVVHEDSEELGVSTGSFPLTWVSVSDITIPIPIGDLTSSSYHYLP